MRATSPAGYVTRGDFLGLEAKVESLHVISRATWTLSAAVAANGTLTLPGGITYEVGAKSARLFYLGLLLAPGQQYNEAGSSGKSSNSMQLLFDADKGDEFQIIVKK